MRLTQRKVNFATRKSDTYDFLYTGIDYASVTEKATVASRRQYSSSSSGTMPEEAMLVSYTLSSSGTMQDGATIVIYAFFFGCRANSSSVHVIIFRNVAGTTAVLYALSFGCDVEGSSLHVAIFRNVGGRSDGNPLYFALQVPTAEGSSLHVLKDCAGRSDSNSPVVLHVRC